MTLKYLLGLIFSIFFIHMAASEHNYWDLNHETPTRESLTAPGSLPTQYISGSMHYFRVHPSDWSDRLKKLRWAGLHAVQTYVEWSSHEPEPGVYDFTEGLNLTRFIEIAQEEGLFVILRPGPFICAERDMGGFPYWLITEDKSMKFRSSDKSFMMYVKRWFQVLLPLIRPLLKENGGPIQMIQVENEYGNCDVCDFQYLTDLKTAIREGLGNKVFLFSTDNGRTEALKCSKIPGVYATVDFGPTANYSQEFNSQRLFEPRGLLINSEFYTGWLDHWGQPHSTTSSQDISVAFKEVLEMGASVNFYMFHGGTSFGFGAGSNFDNYKFKATPTSYDYDAPLNEAGDPTDKYFAIRNIAKLFFPVPSGPAPPSSVKVSYGNVTLVPIASLFDIIDSMPSTSSEIPQTFEDLKVANGIVAYQHIVSKSTTDPAVLSMNKVHDRGYTFVNKEFQGITSREQDIYDLPIQCRVNDTISIFVESQGRISVGSFMKDSKGLTQPPMLNGKKLKKWRMTPLVFPGSIYKNEFVSQVMNFYDQSTLARNSVRNGAMTFYQGNLLVPFDPTNKGDTFLRMDSWTKGYVWINGFLLGRYWPVMGPQLTLYVPHGILKLGSNKILVLELEKVSNLCVSFVKEPEIDGPTPQQ